MTKTEFRESNEYKEMMDKIKGYTKRLYIYIALWRNPKGKRKCFTDHNRGCD